MDKIYTKDKRINQSIAVVPFEDVERAERRRAKRDKRRARRASSAVQREDIRVSKKIAGRHVRTAERRVARELTKRYRHIPLFDALSIEKHKGSLKVLFISASDYAFMGYTLAECLKSIRIEAVAVSDRYSPLRPKSEQGRVCEENELQRLAKETYAIVWMHSLYRILPPEILKGKKCVVFHGGTRYRRKSRSINDVINPKVHLSLVQTGELLKRGAKNEHWFLPPIDTKGIEPDYTFSNDEKLVIGHFSSHPRNKYTKGTSLIESVINSLKQGEWKDHFVYEGGDKKAHIPWKANMERVAKCDIYIESLSQIQPGNPNRHDWSMQALEACALGCITVTNFFFEKQYKNEYGEHGLLVANTDESLRKILIRLFQMDRKELLELKQKARQWVEVQHSYSVVGKRLELLLGLKKEASSKVKSVQDGIISDLAACKAAFDKAEIPWVITDGIVLGHIREGNVMAWDTDLDLGIFREISGEEWQKLFEALTEVGFSIKNLKQDFVYGRRSVKFNLWLFHKKGDFYEAFPHTTKGFKFVEKAEWYDEIQQVDFLDDVYPMPNHFEEYLDAHYGTDWRTRVVKDHQEWFAEKRKRAQKDGDLWPKMLKVDEMP